MQVLLQSRSDETELDAAALAHHRLAGIAADLERVIAEIRALYKAELPPAVIHQISRGARDQVSIGRLMLDDCMLRAAKGTLTTKHVTNAEKWIAGVRQWIEKRQAAYASNTRRKLCIVRTRR